MKVVFAIIFFLCSQVFAFQKVEAIQTPQLLQVGTNAEFAPFSFIKEGQIVGFEIDLVQEVSKKLGCQVKIKDCPFDALIPELKQGSLHFVATGMSITEERERIVDFSTPYLNNNPLVVVYIEGKNHPCTTQELKNFKIVVNEGYTADLYVTEKLKLPLLRLTNPIDAILALKSGRADVFITAENTLKPLAEAESKVGFSYFPIEGTNENCAFMLSKKHSYLRQSLNEALQQLEEEGVLDQLKSKWGLE